MRAWLGTALGRLMVESYPTADKELLAFTDHCRTLRGQLWTLYEEVELALRLLDQLGERVESTRARLAARALAQGQPERQPVTLTATQRQRGQDHGA